MTLADLAPDTLVLTPNERLARHLRAQEDRDLRHAGLEVWEPREILSWRAWLQRLWDEGLPFDTDRPCLLTPMQAAALWQRVLEESEHGPRLLNPRQAARTVAEAWRLLQDHVAHVDPEEPFLSDDSRAFAEWAAEFQQRCEAQGWLDPARLAEALTERLDDALLPEAVALVGFDEITPRQRALLDTLPCEVHELEPQAEPGRFLLARFPSPEDEAYAAARWARGLLQRGADTRIALVVPDLQGVRTVLERALEDVLHPEAVLPEKARKPRPYNLSLGRPLGDRALVRDALNLLRLAAGPLPLKEAGTLLRSPHLGDAEAELGKRGLLDAALRRRLRPQVDLGRLAAMARSKGRDGEPRCPLLADRLDAVRRVTLPRQQSPARWAETFDDLLKAAGWPGERSLDSQDLQTVTRWRELLAEFRTLDPIHGSLDVFEALRILQANAGDAVFQPRGPEAPVQVLGVLEAAGLEFDALWFLGGSDEVWPPAARPNPYLPLDLQRRLGMPHSSPQRELEFAQRVTRRVFQGAPEGVASCPEADGDRELRVSALLRDLTQVNPIIRAERLWRDRIRAAGGTELAEDAPPPPFRGETARGGTRLFKLQAACPFRAFAELRLDAEPLEALQSGLAAKERGTLLHATLEEVWKRLGTQAALQALDEEELAAVAGEAAEHAVQSLAVYRPDVLHGRFRALERDRLQRLALEWLAVERERGPFEVLAFEKSVRIELAGLEFETKIDRLDRLGDGSLAVVDYKTGIPSLRNWLGDRPEEPQLLLYTTNTDHRTSAVVFAQVRPGDMRLKGLSERPNVHEQVTSFGASEFAAEADDWDGLLERWRAVLHSLAAQFREGHAPVDPVRRDTCRYCAQQPLCRVHEREKAVHA